MGHFAASQKGELKMAMIETVLVGSARDVLTPRGKWFEDFPNLCEPVKRDIIRAVFSRFLRDGIIKTDSRTWAVVLVCDQIGLAWTTEYIPTGEQSRTYLKARSPIGEPEVYYYDISRKTFDEFDIEGDYGYGNGYEVLCSEFFYKHAKNRLHEYRREEGQAKYRIKTRRVLKEGW